MQKLDTEYVNKLQRNQVLALDIAEHTGYKTSRESGTIYFPPTDKAAKKYGPDYHQHKAFGDWLRKMIVNEDIKAVAAEDVNVGKNFISLRKLSELRGILLYVCAELDVPVIFFNVSDIKRFATGNGNADKKMMIEYCIKRWHIEPIDDNEADAIHIFFHFIKRYGL